MPTTVASNRVAATSSSRVSAVAVPPRVRDQRRTWTASENAIVNTRNNLIQTTCKETNQVKEKQSFCVKVITDLLGGKRDWKERGTGATQISKSGISKLEKEYQKTPDKIQKQLDKLSANKKVLEECVKLRRLQTQVYAKYGMDDEGHAAYTGVEQRNAKECQQLHNQLQAMARRIGRGNSKRDDRVTKLLNDGMSKIIIG